MPRATFQKRSPVSKRIYEAIAVQECLLVTSPPILAEVRDVISRDYIIKYAHTTPELRARYLADLSAISLHTPGTKALQKGSRDQKDDMFLVCASEAKADYLVTSDEDLLALQQYEGTKIIPPHEFVTLLDKGQP